VDVFCGAGGLTNGLIQGGIVVAAGIDADPACKYPFESNNPGSRFVHSAVEEITRADVSKWWPAGAVRLLAGCAPCAPFSNYSQGKNIETDNRWKLLEHFGRLAQETLPELVTMENVPQLTKNSVFDNFVDVLHKSGYALWYDTVNCARFGVPQERFRLVLLASRLSIVPPRIVGRSSKRTVRATIGRLERLSAGARSPADPLHRTAKLTTRNLERIAASKPGGTWHDWPNRLRVACHTKQAGDGYTAVYGRMRWNRTAPTITTQCYNYGSGRFGHPSQKRAISLREAALLQSFPTVYEFEQEHTTLGLSGVAKMIGNAVPPRLGRAIARSLVSHVRAAYA
jgi:DNA (cytosine-5)-methyltransferase 1